MKVNKAKRMLQHTSYVGAKVSCRHEKTPGADERVKDEVVTAHQRHVGHDERQRGVHARVADEAAVLEVVLERQRTLTVAQLPMTNQNSENKPRRSIIAVKTEAYKSSEITGSQLFGMALAFVVAAAAAGHGQQVGVAAGCLYPFLDVDEPVLDHVVFEADFELHLVELERVDQSLNRQP